MREFSFDINIWDWDLGSRHDNLGYAEVRSKDWTQYALTGQERRALKIEEGAGEIVVIITASESAKRVLDRLRNERLAKEEAERQKQLQDERAARVHAMCHEMLKQMRDLVPLYQRKGFDGMTLVAAVLFALVVLHLLFSIWMASDHVVDFAWRFARPPMAVGRALTSAALRCYGLVRKLI